MADRRVIPLMGTVFTFDLRDRELPTRCVDEVVDWLRYVERVFSTYKVDSAISRLNRGELCLAQCPPEVAEVLCRCAEIEKETDGYFSTRWNGTIDPTGLVKGWSVERASAMLGAAGSTAHSINGGGDIRVAGPTPWTVGIADPVRHGHFATAIDATDLAIATSGTAERGAHIVDPYTRRPVATFASVTVVGPDLAAADAYATAAMAMGESALGWLTARVRYEAFFVSRSGDSSCTPGFVPYLHRPVHTVIR
jgi:FAD:protein FMN transferase